MSNISFVHSNLLFKQANEIATSKRFFGHVWKVLEVYSLPILLTVIVIAAVIFASRYLINIFKTKPIKPLSIIKPLPLKLEPKLIVKPKLEPEPPLSEPPLSEPEPEPTAPKSEPAVLEPAVSEPIVPEPTVPKSEPAVSEPEPAVPEPTSEPISPSLPDSKPVEPVLVKKEISELLAEAMHSKHQGLSPIMNIPIRATVKITFNLQPTTVHAISVIDQSTEAEWLDKCGYHAFKNIMAMHLIDLGLESSALFTDVNFYNEIYTAMNSKLPPGMQDTDISISSLNAFLKEGTSLDTLIQEKTQKIIGIKQLASSISIFNYAAGGSLQAQMMGLSVGDRNGLSSLYNFLALQKKIMKKDQPFVHHVIIGSRGHWVSFSIVQDKEGMVSFYGMDSWGNQKWRFQSHVRLMEYMLLNPDSVWEAAYGINNIGGRISLLNNRLQAGLLPWYKLQLLLDKQTESLKSHQIQNIVCEAIGLDTRDIVGAKYVLKHIGFVADDLVEFTEEEQLAGNTFLREFGLPEDPTVELYPDPHKENGESITSTPVRAKATAAFTQKYAHNPLGIKADFPQYYFLTECLGIQCGAGQKILPSTIAQSLLSMSMKHKLLIGNAATADYPSIFESIEYMRKAGWLEETEKAKHKEKFVPFINVLNFYKTYEPTNERILAAIAELS